MIDSTQKKQRQECRNKRKSLLPAYRKKATLAATNNLKKLFCFQKSKRVACYVANDGEISPHLIINFLWKQKKSCYLPALDPLKIKKLRFLTYDRDSQLHNNHYGIAEPNASIKNSLQPWALDLIITPVVGFDCDGHRIGMGGGYYDRTLSYLRTRQHWRKPYIVGFTFDEQELVHIHTNKWDIPMNAIVTPTRVIYP
ncbi:5-formyltetrahydrofolate cyclo-ligase [hydrothermal vent metagenome]|uniref:5-formyltetrahydrofolate cyclo-ligase n=1 Tax=hydrothermal vent metagenome TaxID=652676 RepID=A0A3B0ZDJ8_9ZZZZ